MHTVVSWLKGIGLFAVAIAWVLAAMIGAILMFTGAFDAAFSPCVVAHGLGGLSWPMAVGLAASLGLVAGTPTARLVDHAASQRGRGLSWIAAPGVVAAVVAFAVVAHLVIGAAMGWAQLGAPPSACDAHTISGGDAFSPSVLLVCATALSSVPVVLWWHHGFALRVDGATGRIRWRMAWLPGFCPRPRDSERPRFGVPDEHMDGAGPLGGSGDVTRLWRFGGFRDFRAGSKHRAAQGDIEAKARTTLTRVFDAYRDAWLRHTTDAAREERAWLARELDAGWAQFSERARVLRERRAARDAARKAAKAKSKAAPAQSAEDRLAARMDAKFAAPSEDAGDDPRAGALDIVDADTAGGLSVEAHERRGE